MLYLMRKTDESVIINNNIEVKILEVRGKTVKLGFSFPPDSTVLRKEIHDRITQENKAASEFVLDEQTLNALKNNEE
ncbi:MAG: carbon storage regulator [Alphaproteobacteria bacterium]|nr:carbon storage regulator [Alphaproteobacteria bacterium]